MIGVAVIEKLIVIAGRRQWQSWKSCLIIRDMDRLPCSLIDKRFHNIKYVLFYYQMNTRNSLWMKFWRGTGVLYKSCITKDAYMFEYWLFVSKFSIECSPRSWVKNFVVDVYNIPYCTRPVFLSKFSLFQYAPSRIKNCSRDLFLQRVLLGIVRRCWCFKYFFNWYVFCAPFIV